MSDWPESSLNSSRSFDVAIDAMRSDRAAPRSLLEPDVERLEKFRCERIGPHRLFLGDCREILPLIGNVDCVVTDPPFGVGFKYESHDDRSDAYEGGYDAWLWGILEQCEEIAEPGAPFFVWQTSLHVRSFATRFPRDWRLFCAAKNFVQMRPTAMQFAYDPVIVWWKDGAKPWTAGTASRDYHVANTAPIVATPQNIERGHPCPRPVDQMRHVIEQWCAPGTRVLDPFAGSGSTGVACARLGRRFVGIELEPKYFEIAVKRISDAMKQPDLFIDRPREKPVQTDFLAEVSA